MRQLLWCTVWSGLILLSSLHAQESEGYSIGQRFQQETSFGDQGLKSESPYWGDNIPLYKTYPNAAKTALPIKPVTGMSVETALRERQSVRAFAASPVSLTDLAWLLLSGNGLTELRDGVAHRTAPSAGALYPIELYVVVRKVDGLAAGLYHFQPQDSTLELVAAGDFSRELNTAANGQGWSANAPLVLVITARFDRTTQKYADRGYRYAYMECGMVAENICLQATSLGLGGVTAGAFNDDAANELVGIDGVLEATLMLLPVGKPAK